MFSIPIIVAGFVHTHAASGGSIEIAGASAPDLVCAHGYIDFLATFVPDTDDGFGIDSVGYTLVDGYGTPLAAMLGGGAVGSEPVTENAVLPYGIENGGINDIAARPVTVQAYDTRLTSDDINGWSGQQLFDAFTNEGTLMAAASYDPAFNLDVCDSLPVPGYEFSPLEVEFVCRYLDPFGNLSDYANWRVRNYNLYGVRFDYELEHSAQSGWVDYVSGTINSPSKPPYIEKEITTVVGHTGRTVFRLLVNGHLEDVAVSTDQVC